MDAEQVDWPHVYPGEELRRRFEDEVRKVRDGLTWAAERLDEPVSSRSVREAAIHLRFVVETLALSSLVLHADRLELSSHALRTLKPEAAVKRLTEVHPNFWPQPFLPNRTTDGFVFADDLSEGFFTPAEIGRSIGQLSDFCHARPLREPSALDSAHQRLAAIHQRLAILAHSFRVDLAADGIGFICWMDERSDPRREGRLVAHFRALPTSDVPPPLQDLVKTKVAAGHPRFDQSDH